MRAVDRTILRLRLGTRQDPGIVTGFSAIGAG